MTANNDQTAAASQQGSAGQGDAQATEQQGQQAGEGQGGDAPETQSGGDGGGSLLTGQQTGAPESYEFAFEGEEKPYSDSVLEAYSESAKELNLTQDQAQKVLSDLAPVIAKAEADKAAADRTAMVEAVKADGELGGVHLKSTLSMAEKAMAAFGNDELRAVLDKTGLGNHPELVRAFAKAGRAISEDTVVTAGAPAQDRGRGAPASGDFNALAARLYS